MSTIGAHALVAPRAGPNAVGNLEEIIGLLEARMTTLRKNLLILFGVAGTLLAVVMVFLVYLRATFEP